MIYRYLIALLVTVSLAFVRLPQVPFLTSCIVATLSIAYIVFMIYGSHIKERLTIAAIECAAMVSALTAFIQFHMALKSQFFLVHYEHIMGYCFLAEIVAIIIGMANSGEFKRLLFVCHSYVFGGTDLKRHNTCSERVLCTATQKTYQAQ